MDNFFGSKESDDVADFFGNDDSTFMWERSKKEALPKAPEPKDDEDDVDAFFGNSEEEKD